MQLLYRVADTPGKGRLKIVLLFKKYITTTFKWYLDPQQIDFAIENLTK